jgi:hypothetical protein
MGRESFEWIQLPQYSFNEEHCSEPFDSAKGGGKK